MKYFIKWSLFLILGLVTLGQFGRVEFSPGIAIYLFEIVLIFFVLPCLTRTSQLKILLKSPLFMLFAIFDLWILLHSLSSLVSLLYYARFTLYAVFGISLYLYVNSGWLAVRWIRTLILSSLVVVALSGLLQYIFIPDTRFLVYSGWDNHLYRLIGVFFDPGFTGIILVMGAIFTLQMISKPNQKRMINWFWVLMLSCFSLSILLTYSRASFVAYLGALMFLILRQRKAWFLLIAALFIICIPLLPRPKSEGARLERTASIEARLESVSTGLNSLTTKQAIFGGGWYKQKNLQMRDYLGSQITSHNSAPDNSYVFIFSSLGVVGVALFLGFVTRVLWNFRKTDVVIAIFVALSLHALFSNTLFYPFVLFYLGVIMVSTSR